MPSEHSTNQLFSGTVFSFFVVFVLSGEGKTTVLLCIWRQKWLQQSQP